MTASIAGPTRSAVAKYRELIQAHSANASYSFMERAMEIAEQQDVRRIIQAYSAFRDVRTSFAASVEESVLAARRAGFEDMRQELFRLGIREGIGPEGSRRYALPSTEQHAAQRARAIARMERATEAAVGRAVRLRKSRGKEVRILDLLAAADGALMGEVYRAERIARTETQIGYNQARYSMMRELGPRHGLRQRWTERINDQGKPLDNKVAPDSFAMHGIISDPGGMFIIPKDDRIQTEKQGKKIRFPPLRPNDRAVLTPVLGQNIRRGT